MSTRTTYRRRGIHIDIGKAKDNLDKDGRPKCFNCNTYRYMAKKCQRLKKEKKTRKYYKYNKVGHIAKNCRLGQKMKNRSVQEDSISESKTVNFVYF